jgi:hypothetical protein
VKKTSFMAGLLLLLLISCDKESEWVVLCGELNDNLAFKEINGNYHYENIEYFFINKKSKKCYRNLDTSNFSYAKSLLDSKLSQLDKNKIDEKVFQTANITKQTKDFVNIEFIDDKGRQILYKINLLDKDNDNVFVYARHKDQYIECMWTDRKSRTRKTKKLIELESK